MSLVGVIAVDQQRGVGESLNEPVDGVEFGVESDLAPAFSPLLAALNGVLGGGKPADETGADVFGDDAVAETTFAIVVAVRTALFPGHLNSQVGSRTGFGRAEAGDHD